MENALTPKKTRKDMENAPSTVCTNSSNKIQHEILRYAPLQQQKKHEVYGMHQLQQQKQK